MGFTFLQRRPWWTGKEELWMLRYGQVSTSQSTSTLPYRHFKYLSMGPHIQQNSLALPSTIQFTDPTLIHNRQIPTDPRWTEYPWRWSKTGQSALLQSWRWSPILVQKEKTALVNVSFQRQSISLLQFRNCWKAGLVNLQLAASSASWTLDFIRDKNTVCIYSTKKLEILGPDPSDGFSSKFLQN